jgi:hypothetical protein
MHLDLSSLIAPTSGLEELSLPFTKEEIDEVIRTMPADKAPGPDGFNGQFLKSCWNIKMHTGKNVAQFVGRNLGMKIQSSSNQLQQKDTEEILLLQFFSMMEH